MNLAIKKTTLLYLLAISILSVGALFVVPQLAANIGISTVAAKKIIDIIDAYSTVATIVSIIGIIAGYGAITTGLVIAAKKVIQKYGKAYAVTW